MAPFPQNDHALLPSPRADELFLDYGPMFEAMRGKKWVLLPHVVNVEGQGVKANLFRVPEGYIVPIIFGGSAPAVIVTLRGNSRDGGRKKDPLRTDPSRRDPVAELRVQEE